MRSNELQLRCGLNVTEQNILDMVSTRLKLQPTQHGCVAYLEISLAWLMFYGAFFHEPRKLFNFLADQCDNNDDSGSEGHRGREREREGGRGEGGNTTASGLS